MAGQGRRQVDEPQLITGPDGDRSNASRWQMDRGWLVADRRIDRTTVDRLTAVRGRPQMDHPESQ
jgi:hypothetical protein